ncbi:MAG: 30S ribosomal protein S8 [Thermoanaerobaculia bacterium]|jgi:small subunit ribosomal protein S8
MSMTDPIADMLSRIRNAIQSRHDRVDVPASKLKVEIARILKEQGFISNYKKIDEGLQGTIRISLKYAPDGEPVIHGIERISRPGRRVYRAKTEIPRPLGGLGLSIVSTSRGVLSGDEAAKTGIGGEVLCQVW